MKTEYEVRVLEIDHNEMVKKLESLGAELKFSAMQQRYVYDFNPVEENRWIRLRTNGIKTTLTIKDLTAKTIDGTKELEIEVDDFENTNKILEELGYKNRGFQQNKRTQYILDGVEIDLDRWPLIPEYLEIEGKYEKAIYDCLNKLGISKDKIVTLDGQIVNVGGSIKRFLNIKDVPININGKSKEASRYNWQDALNSNLKATMTSQEFIGFYMDSTDSVNETFNNSTTQSQIASTINGVSETAKELRFLLGSSSVGELYELTAETATDVMQSIADMTKQFTSGSFIQNIGDNFSTISQGGKLLFPEIWADSEFSKDFSISIKLRTPDSDVMSWFINIYVPLCHLIALAAGHQTETVNGYYSPFLVRAFYKGLFNVDMGIITSMSIRKGKEAAWNIDGLPTEIDVELTIKDLYGMLSIVSDAEPKNFVTNNLLMDYVANSCGININQMDIQRSLEIYYILFTNRIVNLPNRVSRYFQDVIDNLGQSMYHSVLNKFLI